MINDYGLLKNYIDICVNKYVEFMEIENLPSFEIVPLTMSLEITSSKGYGAYATHCYNVLENNHCLRVWSGLYKSQIEAEYILFHEFTHILDINRYVEKNKTQNVAIKGFTEYHAAQVDFLRLLKIKKVCVPVTFTMNQVIESVEGTKTAQDFLINTYNSASSLIERNDFPKDLETLITTFGLVFNYWGRRSICKMYAIDYQNKVNSSTIERFLGHDTYKALDVFMNGWLTEEQITLICDFYLQMVISKVKEYSLN